MALEVSRSALHSVTLCCAVKSINPALIGFKLEIVIDNYNMAGDMVTLFHFIYSYVGYPRLAKYHSGGPDAVAEPVECVARMWEIGSSVPGRVKPMTSQIDTCRFLCLVLDINRIRQGMVRSVSG